MVTVHRFWVQGSRFWVKDKEGTKDPIEFLTSDLLIY
jgi:hypothetical protein